MGYWGVDQKTARAGVDLMVMWYEHITEGGDLPGRGSPEDIMMTRVRLQV